MAARILGCDFINSGIRLLGLLLLASHNLVWCPRVMSHWSWVIGEEEEIEDWGLKRERR
jgi:hypothetical protein